MKGPRKNRHIVEIAKARVLVEDGNITILSRPARKRCPVHPYLSGVEEVTVENVIRAAESMVKDEGMFTAKRMVESSEELVPFGASEMLMSGLRHGVIDCAVVVCDCAGSVVTTRPEVVQGIGKKMTGLLETSPIQAVIERLKLKDAEVLDPAAAKIDQAGAAARAFQLGYRKIAVTVTGMNTKEIITLRRFEEESGAALLLLAVHNSGIREDETLLLAERTDLVWGCASRAVREIAGKRALLQIGIQIPVFAMTERGKDLALARMRDLHDQLLIGREKLPKIVRGLHPRPLE